MRAQHARRIRAGIAAAKLREPLRSFWAATCADDLARQAFDRYHPPPTRPQHEREKPP